MKFGPIVVLACLILALVSPVIAADEEKYSYIRVKEVSINVENDKAVVEIGYSLDEGIRLLILLLGKGDLKNKLLKIVNYEDATIQDVNLERAVILVDNASADYGDGCYWFPEHTFSVTVPSLEVRTPQTVRRFNMTKSIPVGIGHFGVDR
ncbi:MAG: hypothetical protein EHJ95_01275 [Methanobacteriota archaeon]|nr:MAG: hypothetical protein EHJ95_01275 [Euryarchaeota archaeon]